MNELLAPKGGLVWRAIFVCELPSSIYQTACNVVVWIRHLVASRTISDLKIDKGFA